MTVADGPATRAKREAFFMLLLHKLSLWDEGYVDISFGNHRYIIESSTEDIKMWEGTLINPRMYEHVL